MPARLLDGRGLAQERSAALAARSDALRARDVEPKLAVVTVGDDPGSAAYVRGIQRVAARVGIDVCVIALPATNASEDVRAALAALDLDRAVHGVILQQPLPAGLPIREIADAVPPLKDVDGVNPLNQGRLASNTGPLFIPATPAAVIMLLERSEKWPLRGREITVVGRSPVVGLPATLLLIARDATVTIVHRGTRDLPAHVRRAEIVVVAAGKPGLVTGAMLNADATVIDVGTNVVDGKVVGDVDFPTAVEVVREITPVPGGVGPVTNVALMANVLTAAERLSGTGPGTISSN